MSSAAEFRKSRLLVGSNVADPMRRRRSRVVFHRRRSRGDLAADAKPVRKFSDECIEVEYVRWFRRRPVYDITFEAEDDVGHGGLDDVEGTHVFRQRGGTWQTSLENLWNRDSRLPAVPLVLDVAGAPVESRLTRQRTDGGSGPGVGAAADIGGTAGIPICLALFSFFLIRIFPLESLTNPPPSRLFTVEELALYNGTDLALPILLGILGSVFDVSKGKSHYGDGGSYNHFSGRDASRAFVSGNFTGEGLTDNLHGLSKSEVKSIVDWREFYFKTYTFVGKLVGRYYDKEGKPTKYLKGIEAKAARGSQLLEKQKKKEAEVASCNSKWSQEEGSEVWCDEGYPRLVQRPTEIALTGKMSRRCACFKESELGQTGLEVYERCDYFSKKCKL
ncbi:membrane-associated progesterone receptor component 1 [Striga asiatica]|uniref:Membrane-associated progesterone receptor component 1 n=1 Tax=Striga asiatica TaxID=4170 RepID=A0A5A7Q2D3_STRAF|nr:membrane-associated progesterone receptor component 1 [Striga asiatica]